MTLSFITQKVGGGVLVLCKSTDQLPTGCNDNWQAIETDTGKRYRWWSNAWQEQGASGAAAWGEVTGTLANQTDLQDAMNAKAAASHNHDGSYATAAHNHDGVYSLAGHTHPGGSEAFPIGSVFIAVVSTNPATLLGYGTWSAFAAGRMLVGRDSGDVDFDTAEETGGAKTVTLTEAQMPSHTHVQNAHSHVITSQTATTGSATSYEHGTLDTSSAEAEATETTNTTVATNQNTGGGQAHPNLPPYIVVYMWKRTA